MDKFNGFSQDEINRVTTGAERKIVSGGGGKHPKMETNKMGIRGQHQGIRRIADNNNNNNNNYNNLKMKQQQQQQLQNGKISQTNKIISSSAARANSAQTVNKPVPPTTAHSNSTVSSEEDTLSRTMSKSIEEALFYQPLKILATNGQTQMANNGQKDETDEATDDHMHIDIEVSDETGNTDDDIITDYTSSNDTSNIASNLPLDSPFKGLSLKEFEVHRKMVEEQNRQKKQLLCKAIELHSKKTAAETRKIEDIKIELAKLDNELAADVAILRKQIDTACIHFANIEKHYMKIEAQFLKAKMELHQAAEKKELLTEHLCTVIAHNEDRKAEKLTELMQKVGLSPSGEIQNAINSS